MRNEAKKTRLILEDGAAFEGVLSAGADGARGEVTVNNSIVGFQEIMTDPANAGKIIIFTTPHIGNCGAADKFNESSGSCARAIAVKSLSPFSSNWQSETTFGEFLRARGAVCAENLDTREAARHIHEKGEMKGIITSGAKKPDFSAEAFSPAKTAEVSTKKIKSLNKKPGSPSIGILDLGVKNSLLAQLRQNKVHVILFPHNATASEILRTKISGLIISGGPEDEAAIGAAADTAGQIRGKIPMLGIASGCIALGLLLGGKMKKLRSGHRGMNYPVKARDSFKGEITVQNHRLFIEKTRRMKMAEITLSNINDATAEALHSPAFGITGIQYEPEPPCRGATHRDIKIFLDPIVQNHA